MADQIAEHSKHDLIRTLLKLQDTERALQEARNELDMIHRSRAYQFAIFLRDAKNSRIQRILLPLRLLMLILPLRIREHFEKKSLPLFQKYLVEESKRVVIHNAPWPKDRPLVSVIIPCFNYGRYVEEAIDSVLSQTWHDLEIIVVDDGSDDPHTLDVLKNLNKPKTQVLRQDNGKPAKARNSGIRRAMGKYICCLDADDRLAPTYLEKCLFHLEKEGLDICCSLQQDFGAGNLVQNPGPFSLERLLRENCLTTASVFKKDLCESVGGYDETMIDGYEDWEFWIRMAGAGARASVIQEPLFLYRRHGNSYTDETREKQRNVVESIHRKHLDLLKNRKMVSGLDRRRGPVSVEDGLCNLVSATQPPALRADKDINILLATSYLVLGGAEALLSQVCGYLSGRNIRFTIVTTWLPLAGEGDTTSLFEKATDEIYHLPRFLEESQWQPFISFLLQSRPIDIIWQIGSSYFYQLMPWIKTHFPRVKILDLLFNTEGHGRENRMYSCCLDLNIVENNMMKSWLLENGEDEDRISVIPNGVDLERFKPRPKQPLPFDSKGAAFVVGFFGRFSHEKGPDIFVEVARLLQKDLRVLFIMAGGGALEKDVQTKIRKYGLEQSVKLLGFVVTSDFLACCDAVLVPSRIDGRPNVLLESLAMGVPVIATAVGGIPEVLREGEAGFLCNSPDPNEFCDRLTRLLSEPSLLQAMKINARRRAEAGLGVEKTLADYEKLSYDLLGRQHIL